METVCVMMSTYNGEKFLERQIDSILDQKEVNIELIIRDDGSNDATCKIIQKYIEKHKNIQVYFGINLGYERSFFDLMLKAGEYKYYAFSDQDDVWDDFKLKKAIEKMQEIEKNLLTTHQ